MGPGTSQGSKLLHYTSRSLILKGFSLSFEGRVEERSGWEEEDERGKRSNWEEHITHPTQKYPTSDHNLQNEMHVIL